MVTERSKREKKEGSHWQRGNKEWSLANGMNLKLFCPSVSSRAIDFFPWKFSSFIFIQSNVIICVSLVDKIVLDIVFYPLINDFDSTLWIVYFYAMKIFEYIYIYIYIVFHGAKFFHFIGINPIFNETFLKNSPTNSSIYILRWPQNSRSI